MTPKPTSTITFEAEKIIQPIYTGGEISVDSAGKYLATCLGDQVVLSNAENGQLILRIEGDGEPITALILTPDGSHIISCSRSSLMNIYSLERSDEGVEAILRRALKPFSTPVVSVSVDVTSTLVATGGADGSIKVWDVRGGFITHTFRAHTGIVSALKLFSQADDAEIHDTHIHRHQSHDIGKRMQAGISGYSYKLASGGEDGKIRIWDLHKKRSMATLESHVSVIRSIDYSKEQNALITGSRDKTIAIWDGLTWKRRKIVPALESIEGVGFIGGGERFYSGGENGRLRIWDTENGHEITRGQKEHSEAHAFVCLANAQSSQMLVCARVDQMLEFRDLSCFAIDHYPDSDQASQLLYRLSGTHDEIIDFAFVSKERSLMAIATNTEQLKIISTSGTAKGDAQGCSQLFGADIALLEGHKDIIICLDVDWSGQWIVTGAKDNTARLWHVNHEHSVYECAAVFTGHAGSIGAIALPQEEPPPGSAAHKDPGSYPPKYLVTGSQDQTIKKWKIALKSPAEVEKSQLHALYTHKAHEKDINALAINHDSTLFASASQDRLVKIWSTEEGEVQGVLRGHKRGVWSVKFGPKELPQVTGDSHTGNYKKGIVLTGSGDKSLKIWSLHDYSCLRTFEGHTNSVLKVVWALPSRSDDAIPSKRTPLAASAGGDGLVKVWDIQSGECLGTLDNHTERVWALTTSPDLAYLVSGGGDGVITFWADTTVATAETAAAETNARIEQEQELANHVRRGRYRDAILLALRLNHPARLLALFSDIIKKHPGESGSLSGSSDVDKVILSLSDEQLFTLLLRIRDWNTNTRSANVSQRLLWVIMKGIPASRLARLRKRGRGLGEVLDGLRTYTERHYKRMEEFLEESYLVDYVVWNMGEEGFADDDPWLPSRDKREGGDALSV